MTEPLKLPEEPTLHDIGVAITLVHECLEATRSEIRTFKALPWTVIKWLAPIIVSSFVAAGVQSYAQNQILQGQTEAAAAASKTAIVVSARTHAVVVQKLGAP